MATVYKKVVCLQGFSSDDSLLRQSFSLGQVYEIPDIVANKFIATGFLKAYDGLLLSDPSLPSIVRTKVIRLG